MVRANEKVDAALFYRFAAHRDFVKLQADLEIYVNGIATGRIRNLNAWIDTARVKSWRIVGRESMMEPLLC